MLRCTHCGQSNPDTASRCRYCGRESLRQASSSGLRPDEPASPGLRRGVWTVAIMSGLVLVSGAVALQSQQTKQQQQLQLELAAREKDHEQVVRLEESSREAKVVAEERAHRARLEDPALLSGAPARQRYSNEWARRVAHDPQLAVSAVESTLLRMEELGRDPGTAAANALEAVARLTAPRGSRIEVLPQGDRFRVRVAFRMSALAQDERGAATKHQSRTTMRHEAEELCARVVKDLFDYCGSRGIAQLIVSCNRGLLQSWVPENATAAERAELESRARARMRSIYRVSLDHSAARAVSDWRRISVAQVIALMKVEYDGVNTMVFTDRLLRWNEQQDPRGELEF
jgi:hypothetical protein